MALFQRVVQRFKTLRLNSSRSSRNDAPWCLSSASSSLYQGPSWDEGFHGCSYGRSRRSRELRSPHTRTCEFFNAQRPVVHFQSITHAWKSAQALGQQARHSRSLGTLLEPLTNQLAQLMRRQRSAQLPGAAVNLADQRFFILEFILDRADQFETRR